jgi:hypothetical protein
MSYDQTQNQMRQQGMPLLLPAHGKAGYLLRSGNCGVLVQESELPAGGLQQRSDIATVVIQATTLDAHGMLIALGTSAAAPRSAGIMCYSVPSHYHPTHQPPAVLPSINSIAQHHQLCSTQ